jgi:hypothetical protein
LDPLVQYIRDQKPVDRKIALAALWIFFVIACSYTPLVAWYFITACRY